MLNFIFSAIVGGIVMLLSRDKGLSEDTIFICYCISYFLSLIYLEIKDFKKEKNK